MLQGTIALTGLIELGSSSNDSLNFLDRQIQSTLKYGGTRAGFSYWCFKCSWAMRHFSHVTVVNLHTHLCTHEYFTSVK